MAVKKLLAPGFCTENRPFGGNGQFAPLFWAVFLPIRLANKSNFIGI